MNSRHFLVKAFIVSLSFFSPFLSFSKKHPYPSPELLCESENTDIAVEVIPTYRGYSAIVYEDGFVVIRQFVEAKKISDGEGTARQTRIIFRGGSVLDGGVNIRIITSKPAFPEVEGTGHITFKSNGRTRNTWLRCDLYPESPIRGTKGPGL